MILESRRAGQAAESIAVRQAYYDEDVIFAKPIATDPEPGKFKRLIAQRKTATILNVLKGKISSCRR